MANPTIKKVELCLHPPGGYRTIYTVKQAAGALLDRWPTNKQQGPQFEEACLACMSAMDHGGPPERVREALWRAVAAGIDIRVEGYEVG
jgi:hypothetical protein